jgi:hypothetical protein
MHIYMIETAAATVAASFSIEAKLSDVTRTDS